MTASSNIEQVSAILGQHLLAGWTMSAEACPNAGCVGCPLMTKDDVSFCARCDKLPQVPEHSSRKSKAGLDSDPSESTIQGRMTPDSTSTLSLDSVSTPPTPSSQTRTLNDVPPAPAALQPPQPSSAELQRRAQSDRASTAISEKMLQGWRLLAQECPNPDCHAVPLMKPPKARPAAAPPASVPDASALMSDLPASGRMRSSSKRSKFANNAAAPQQTLTDPRMLCVACGSRYLNEADVAAFQAYENQQKAGQAANAGPSSSKRPATTEPPLAPAQDEEQQARELQVEQPSAKRQHVALSTATPAAATPVRPLPSQQSDLGQTLQSSLEASLRNLSGYLIELNSITPRPGQAMPLIEISQTAQAITSLSHALKEARSL